MKIAVLDSYSVTPGDLDWSPLFRLADQVELYPRTAPQEIVPRLQGARIAISNKCVIGEAVLAACPDLEYIALTATGTDRIDLEACRRHGVKVANVPGYSTYSVAQHTFALLLEIANGTARRAASVRDGHWQLNVPACYGIQPHLELYGLTFGILGYGAIGQAAARIAQGFGMKVLAHTRTVKPEYTGQGVEFVGLDELLARADVVSLHCPATPETKGIIGPEALAKMKPGAILLNTARGALVNEEAVAEAVKSGRLFWYAADTTVSEPLPPDSPLRQAENILITPHIAWTTTAALQRLAREVCENVAAFLAGESRNIVNG